MSTCVSSFTFPKWPTPVFFGVSHSFATAAVWPGDEIRSEKILQLPMVLPTSWFLMKHFPVNFHNISKIPLRNTHWFCFFWGRWPTFLRWVFPWHSWNSDSERCGQLTCSPSLRNQCLLYIFEYNFLMSTTTNCISPYTFSRLLNWFLLCENIGNDPMYQWYELCTHVAVPVQSSEDCHGIVADGSLTRNHWLSSCHPRSFKCCA